MAKHRCTAKWLHTVVTVNYLQMFAVPVVSKGRVMEVPGEPANMSMLNEKLIKHQVTRIQSCEIGEPSCLK